MNHLSWIKEASDLHEKLKGLQKQAGRLGSAMNSIGAFAKKPTTQVGAKMMGLGLAGGLIGGKNMGYNTGYNQGASQGFGAGTTMGYNQGYNQASNQARNTNFFGRMMNRHDFNPTGPEGPGVSQEELLQLLAGADNNRPGALRRLTGFF